MGPRVFTRGNSIICSAIALSALLQWGHASSRVETQGDTPMEVKIEGASMGPRVFTRGNHHAAARANTECLWLQWGHASSRVETRLFPESLIWPGGASMGPRVFTRGNIVTDDQDEWQQELASMGPRVFTRGNTLPYSERSMQEFRFNGATRLHAWKRICAAGRRPRRPRFNGATRLHAWKQGKPKTRAAAG